MWKLAQSGHLWSIMDAERNINYIKGLLKSFTSPLFPVPYVEPTAYDNFPLINEPEATAYPKIIKITRCKIVQELY